MLVTSYDIRAFFDSENIYNVFRELYTSQVKGKLYRLLFQMNKNTRIIIKTPVGDSEARDTGPVITQGGVESAVISSVSIDRGTDVAFAASDDEAEYHGIRLAPFRWMDDILRVGDSVASAQTANENMEDMFEKKSLSFNMTKSQFILIGNKTARKKLRNQLTTTPLKLCSENMQETNMLKYLGDYLTFDLEDSVHQTVTNRVGVAKKAILDIRTVIEDTRANKLGALSLAYELWTQSVSPMLYTNSESWISVSKKTLKILDGLFQDLSQKMWRASSGSPIPSYYWISGCLKSENIILQRKLNFAHHVANLPIDSLARAVFDTQKNCTPNEPNLFAEVEPHLVDIGVNELRDIPKGIWKRKVKKYVMEKQRRELLEDVKKYKKLSHEELSTERFEQKSFLRTLSLENARMRCKIFSGIIPTVRTQFSRKYTPRSLTCPGCTSPNATPPPHDSNRHRTHLSIYYLYVMPIMI